MSLSELTSLQNTLNSALAVYKAELSAEGLPDVSYETSKPHPIDDPAYLPSPAMYEARRLVVASLGRIKSLVQSPYDALLENTLLSQEAACVRLAADLHLATILGDSEEGLSFEEIAAKAGGVNAAKLLRVLRLLVSQGWFRETIKDHFANSRRSNLLKDGQDGYYSAQYGNPLYMQMSLGLPGMINNPDPAFRDSADPVHGAFQLAFNTDVPFLGPNGWLAQHPEDAAKFSSCMAAIGGTSDPGIVADFPWKAFAEGKDGVVDIGGGVGTLSCSLALKYPELKTKFIAQDIAEVQKPADEYIAGRGVSDRVSFEPQDFFAPQRRKGKYLFTIQRVLHNWGQKDGARILSNIRDVLDKDSSILIIDPIMPSGVISHEPVSVSESLAELQRTKVYAAVPTPPYLPEDLGDASQISHSVGNVVMGLCNTYQRSLADMHEVVEMAGLKIKKIHRGRGWVSIVEAGLP